MRRAPFWWESYGTFPPADERGLWPDPASVIRHYCLCRQVSLRTLAQELGLTQRTMQLTLSRRAGLDSLCRRRYFVRRLDIPPLLLGLDAPRQPTSQHRPWWIEAGYPSFEAGTDGSPHAGQVIKWYRQRMVKTLPEGTRKSWTQQDLGQAFDPPLSEISVNKMERHLIGLDSLSRRRALSFILSIPPALLGLADPPREGLVPLHTASQPRPDARLLARYRSEQARLFSSYYTQHGQDELSAAAGWISHLSEDILPLASGAQQQDVLRLLANYHIFITLTAREQCNYRSALNHANMAVSLAQDTHYDELTAIALFRRAEVQREGDLLTEAVNDINGALLYARHAAPAVKAKINTEAGLILAQAAHSESERTAAFSHFDQAARLLQRGDFGDDPYFLKTDWGFYHLRRSMALTVRNSPAGLSDSLEQARRLTPGDLQRRRLILSIIEAQGLLASAARARSPLSQEQCYAEATLLALDALALARQLQSRLNRDRIEGMYQQLKSSPYGGDPSVVRLGLLLSTW